MCKRSPTTRTTTVRGFSLAELVTVVAVVATVSAITAPRYAAAQARYRADAAARRVMADLKMATQTAVTQSKGVSITFSPLYSTYQISGAKDLKRSDGVYFVDLKEAPYRAKIDSAWFGADNEIVLDGYGVGTESGSVVIYAGGQYRSVAWDGVSARMSVLHITNIEAFDLKNSPPLDPFSKGIPVLKK